MRKTGAKIFVNAITLTRIIGTFLMPFISNKLAAEGILIYIIAILLTDSLDGILARKLKVCTLFGALLDTLADKLFGIALLIILAKKHSIMLIPITLEIVIILINTVSGARGSAINSSHYGKIKTWILGVCIVLGFITIYSQDLTLIIKFNLVNRILNLLFMNQSIILLILGIIASISSLIVALDYFIRRGKEIVNNHKKGLSTRKIKIKSKKELLEALFDVEFYEKNKNESLLYKLGKEE